VKAREAMNSLDGLEQLHMSGSRAVFQLEKGAKIQENDIASAFEDVGMKLESYTLVQRQRATRVYLVDAGIT
jgi:hypothetical protein